MRYIIHAIKAAPSNALPNQGIRLKKDEVGNTVPQQPIATTAQNNLREMCIRDRF